MQKLFDNRGYLEIGEIVANHPSYINIMKDGIVTDEELRRQADATLASLHHLQELCNDQQQAAIVDAISEMSVLFAVYHNYELEELRQR